MEQSILYAENSTPFNPFTSPLPDKPTRYYFLTSSRSSCLKSNRLPLLWDNVRAFGSKKQQKALNLFRKKYIKQLIIGYCNENGCSPVMIGSPPSSAKSDADFDMYSKEKDVDQVIMEINKIHHQRFIDPIEDMFDVNIYGTVADVFQNIRCNIERCVNQLPQKTMASQTTWAFIRVAEQISVHCPNFYEKLSEKHQKLYNECMERIKNLEVPADQKKAMYLKHLKMYLDGAKEKKPDMHKLSETYSTAKYYERETYKSIGATLNIVKKREDLPLEMLMDSIYDNLGFLAEVVFPEQCNVANSYKLMKATKYLARICKVMLAIQKDQKVNDILAFCNMLNNKRKRFQPMTAKHSAKIKALLSYKRNGPLWFFEAVYRFVSAFETAL